MKIPAVLDPSSITVICDSREQNPLNLDPLRTEIGCLATGDYSVKGLEHVVSIERKSLEDLLACVGRERDRFDREIQRMMGYQVKVLLVESTWADIETGDWRSRVTPDAAIGSLLGWIGRGVQVELVGDHHRAGRYASRLLYTIARRRWRELRALAGGLENG